MELLPSEKIRYGTLLDKEIDNELDEIQMKIVPSKTSIQDENLHHQQPTPHPIINQNRVLEKLKKQNKKLNEQLDREKISSDLEEFFYPGCDELIEVRKFILQDSLLKASNRLQLEHEIRSQIKATELRSERLNQIYRMKNFELNASIVASERPISCSTMANNSIDTGNSSLITADWGGNVKKWSVPTLQLEHSYNLNDQNRISGLSTHSNSDFLMISCCTFDGSIFIWKDEIIESKLFQPLKLPNEHKGRVSDISIHPSGKFLASSGFDCYWKFWDLQNEKLLSSQQGHKNAVYCLDFHSDGGLLATGGLDAIGRIWDLRLGTSIMTIQGHSKGLLSCSFSPTQSNILATSSEDNSVRFWDLRQPSEPSKILLAHTNLISDCKWDPTGTCLMTCSFDGCLKIFSSHDLHHVKSFQFADTKFTSLACSADFITATSMEKIVRVWC